MGVRRRRAWHQARRPDAALLGDIVRDLAREPMLDARAQPGGQLRTGARPVGAQALQQPDAADLQEVLEVMPLADPAATTPDEVAHQALACTGVRGGLEHG